MEAFMWILQEAVAFGRKPSDHARGIGAVIHAQQLQADRSLLLVIHGGRYVYAQDIYYKQLAGCVW
jgi:hypothetical protein